MKWSSFRSVDWATILQGLVRPVGQFSRIVDSIADPDGQRGEFRIGLPGSELGGFEADGGNGVGDSFEGAR